MSNQPVKFISHTVHVNVRDGRPVCPGCQEPMVEVADNQWQCPTGAVFTDAIAQILDNEMNRTES